MNSGFSTDDFLKFSKPASDCVIDSGYLNLLSDRGRIPHHSVFKFNENLGKSCSFVVSPICLSGSQHMDFEAEIQYGCLAGDRFDGGFLQSRTESNKGSRLVADDKWLAYIDYRTNYRLPLNQTVEDLLRSMKRDSRSRVRKILAQRDRFELSLADSDDAIKTFSDLYSTTAARLNFSKAYTFSLEQWRSLLLNDCWRLYILRMDGREIAGSVVCELEEGFDYTFTAYNPNHPEGARAILALLFLQLSSESSAFLDLGGGITEDDALASFKLSMGGHPCSFERARFVRSDLVSHLDAISKECLLKDRWP